jgi:uncharacterized caspase-like protein
MARNWAITIGVNKYSYLRSLNHAVRDADAVSQFFMQEMAFHQIYHFTDESLPIPQDYGPDMESKPTGSTLRRFLRTRFEQPFLRDGDNLWFFFAGHGIRHEGRDYLMPIDGDPGDLQNSAIPIHHISECLRRSGADNIILLIDACRSYEGRRDGVGIGKEKQQGVITLFSCSPEESSYEIQELQQGAFTHVLLNSLRLQGEGNCATVERLYQRLRYYVPQLTRQYMRVDQTPYGVIEPLSKNHLILLPRQATLGDIEVLKKDALTAEIRRNAKAAKQLWIRVLAVSPADPEAIEGIERLWGANISESGAATGSSSPQTAMLTSLPSPSTTPTSRSGVSLPQPSTTISLDFPDKARHQKTKDPVHLYAPQSKPSTISRIRPLQWLVSRSPKSNSIFTASQSSVTSNTPQKIAAVLPLLTVLSGVFYFWLGGDFGSQLTASNDGEGAPANSTTDSTGPTTSPDVRTGAALAVLKVGTYVRIRQSDLPGIVSNSANPEIAAETSQLRLYPNPTLVERSIPGTLPAGSIVQVMEKVSAEQTKWVRLKVCSIPSGASLSAVPVEADSPETNSSQMETSSAPLSNLNGSAAEPFKLPPGSEGWTVEGNVAAVADNVKNLHPTQLGNCER